MVTKESPVMERIWVTNEDGVKKRAGVVDRKNRVLRKKVNKDDHLLRCLDAWGLDAGVFEDWKDEVDWVEIWETTENVVYTVAMKTYKQFGEYRWFKPHGKQIFLPREHWGQEKLEAYNERKKEEAGRSSV